MRRVGNRFQYGRECLFSIHKQTQRFGGCQRKTGGIANHVGQLHQFHRMSTGCQNMIAQLQEVGMFFQGGFRQQAPELLAFQFLGAKKVINDESAVGNKGQCEYPAQGGDGSAFLQDDPD